MIHNNQVELNALDIIEQEPDIQELPYWEGVEVIQDFLFNKMQAEPSMVDVQNHVKKVLDFLE